MTNVQRGARAGIAALALGLSLAGPGIAVASADDADHSSASDSSSSATSSSGSAQKTTGHTARGPKSTASSAADSTTGKSSTSSKKTAAASSTVSGSSSRPEATSRRTSSNSTTSSTTGDTTAADTTASSTDTTANEQPAADTTSTTATASNTAQITAAKTSAGKTASANADPVTALLQAIQDSFAAAGLLIRRSFFNEAPSVSVVQLTGQTTGPISGDVYAVDPEGDEIVYKLTQQAHYGTVALNQDGTYTYAPTPGGQCSSTCIDSFTVSATDTGLHINLLNWFREASTSAAGDIYQQPAGTKRITFTFNYGNGSQFWNSAARADLQSSAIILSSYFVPSQNVNITYAVTGQFNLMGGTLASAGSDLIGDQDFQRTVVQEKILTGNDTNGSAADGTITWNFGYGWGYGDTVPAGSYDFQSTAMHELMHTFGFLSVVDSAGNNTVENWTDFDRFMTDKDGHSVFNGTAFNPAYNANLTGGVGNGMYFGGDNAKAANNNNPVPLYSPNPWESGSSMSHLNDDYYNGSTTARAEKLMNAASDTGLGVRTLSAIEIGIMKDLGYTMVSQSAGAAVLFLGLMLVRRRRQR